jgi:hypothetical protein
MAKKAITNNEFKLVFEPIPGRQRTSLYFDIVANFLAEVSNGSGTSSRVDLPSKKGVTLVQGLRKAIEANEPKWDDVHVVQRKDDTYLEYRPLVG